ncbi:hypothetical protein COU57_03510 [Candidatus Pacearchaeota archaeon CG10_big_fil_rev_8_21_14_0_10_32_14]|nr:MAG: hypothetical protein COU57_03510 [Candidatus Pacearchaeota archaeon CG10_big_fil_rev_8_21_14_0_10_32_14]
MPLESVIEEININQRKGIFELPKRVKEDVSIKRWFDNVVSFEEVPVVVREESYNINSVHKKIGMMPYEIARKLTSPGILRHKKRESKLNKISQLSLAQLFSWSYQKPIEEILISQDYFKSPEFKRSTPKVERVSFLCNAYEGTRWFENFRKHVFKISDQPPKIYSWQRISRFDVADLFLIGNGNKTSLDKLTSLGFLIPKNKNFQRSSKDNIVDNKSLAQLIACLYDTPLSEVFSHDSSYINYLSRNYLENKLIPYLKENDIDPLEPYTLKEASEIIKRPFLSIQSAGIKNRIRHLLEKPYRALGIDFAIYTLKETQQFKYTYRDLIKLFGVNKLDLRLLVIKPSKDMTFSRHHYVYPLYDLVTDKARKIYFNEDEKDRVKIMTCKYGSKSLILTRQAIKSYLSSYNMTEFTEECRIHIESELEKRDQGKDGSYSTRDLTFRIKNSRIEGIEMLKN